MDRPATLIRHEAGHYCVIWISTKAVEPSVCSAAEHLLRKDGNVRAEWLPVVEAMAFSKLVASEVLGQAVKVVLILPDATAKNPVENLYHWVHSLEEHPFLAPTVHAALERARDLFVAVNGIPDRTQAEVARRVEQLRRHRAEGIRPSPQLGYHCRNCVYRGCPDFEICWGDRAGDPQHMFDLHQLYAVKDADGWNPLATPLIRAGKSSMYDLPDEAIAKSAHSARQEIQLAHTRPGKEWIDPGLKPALESLQYPLHFYDCETWRTVIPPYEGLRP